MGKLPLEGIRVLDLGQYITGPFAAVMLAELGADVVKIESPNGDPFRTWEGGPVKATFVAFNRGKRSVVVDLKTLEGKEDLLGLVKDADVLIENFRPGVLDALGLSYEVCRKTNSSLVYCSITGFGKSGPYAQKPAFDGVALAYSGMAGLLTDQVDTRLRGPAIADTVTGYAAALSILAHLREPSGIREATHIEISMLGALSHFLQPTLYRYAIEGVEETPYTRPHNSQAFLFKCSADGALLIHLSAPVKFWLGLCRATGRLDLVDDDRFASREGRRKNHEELRAILQEVFMTKSRGIWLSRLEEEGVPCAPVNRVPEVLEDPGLEHLGLLERSQDARGADTLALSFPALVDGSPLPPLAVAPTLGADSDAFREQQSWVPQQDRRHYA